MAPRSQRMAGYILAGLLLAAAVVCYAAFDPPAPETPIRLIFKNTAGDVMYSHKEHTDTYGLMCTDCHHMWDEAEGSRPAPCAGCHGEDTEYPIKISDAYHQQCQGCHMDFGAGPTECNQCHVR